jgi:diguanylate cyclase (GGDEF)-like protein/PAS domain S-box-containing protein
MQSLVAAAYLLSGVVVHYVFKNALFASVIWPGSGIALAALLIGGKQLMVGVLAGSLLLNMFLQGSPLVSCGFTLANTLEAALGYWLLARTDGARFSLRNMPDFLRLAGWGGVASLLGATIGAATLMAAGLIAPNDTESAVQWWMGDTLGIALFAPLILVWWQQRATRLTGRQLAEKILLLGATFVMGQIVFLGWLQDYVTDAPKGYWAFLLISLVAIRLGSRATPLALVMIALQALLGAYREVGFFAHDLIRASLHNYGAYMLILAVVGMSIATHADEIKRAAEMLRDSEARFRRILQRAPIGMVTTALDGHVMLVNRALCDILGYSREELEKKTFRDFTHPEDIALTADNRKKLLDGEIETYQLDKRYFHKDGRVVWARLTSSLEHDEGGAPAYFISQVEDISDQIEAKEWLRKLSTAVEQSGASVVITDLEANIEYVNSCFCKTTGYSASEVIGQNPRLLQSGQTAQETYAGMWEKLAGGEVWNGELLNKRKDGELYWEDASIAPIKNARGETTHYVGVKTDITARKKIEIDLLRVSMALEQSGEPVALTDEQSRYIYANSAFCKLFGYELTELIGNSIGMLMPPEELAGMNTRQTTAIAHEQGAFLHEVWRRAKDGAIIPILLKVSPFSDEWNELVGYIGTMTDLTDIKRMENALRESEQHFRDIIEHAPLGTVTVTLDGRFIEVNQAFCDIVGYPRETLKNLSFEILTHPDDIRISHDNIRRLLAGEIDSYRVEKRYFHKDGHIVWARVNASLQRGLMGEPQSLIAQMENISEHKNREWQLRQLNFALSHIQEAIYLMVEDAKFLYVNDEACRMLGYTREEFMGGMAVPDINPDWSYAKFAQLWQALKVQRSITLEGCHRAKDGRLIPVEVSTNYFEYEGRGYNMSMARDITRRRQDEENLRITASVFDNSQEAVLITDADNTILNVNPAFTRITGYSRDEALGENPKILSSGRQDRAFYEAMWRTLEQERAWRGEIWNRRKSGEIYAEQLSISAICNQAGRAQRYVAVFSDISHVKAHEAQLNHIAHYDTLTGIPNRLLLADRMKQAIAQSSRERSTMAVCYLDLDGFKPVNDILGHEAGDRVLVEIARRIEATIRGGDTVARIGGDEFVVLLQGLGGKEESEITLQRLVAAIARPLPLNGDEVKLGASIGVSMYPQDGDDADTLLRCADQAMYAAKKSGKNRYCFAQTATVPETH